MEKHDSEVDDIIFNTIENLRHKLLDLSARNVAISFKHSNKSKRLVRFIDDDIDNIYSKLNSGSEICINGIPVPDLEPEDEKSELFKSKLKHKKDNDQNYIEEVGKLGVNPSKRKLAALENSLRDIIRSELGLHPIDRAKRPKIENVAT